MENEMNNSAANTQEAGVAATTEAQVSQAPPAGAESSAAGTVTQTEGEAQQQGSQTETGTERTVQNAEQNHRFAEMRRREQREQVFRDLLIEITELLYSRSTVIQEDQHHAVSSVLACLGIIGCQNRRSSLWCQIFYRPFFFF